MLQQRCRKQKLQRKLFKSLQNMSLGNNTSVLCKPLARSTKHLATRNLLPSIIWARIILTHNLRNRKIEHSLNFLIRRGWRASRGSDHLSELDTSHSPYTGHLTLGNGCNPHYTCRWLERNDQIQIIQSKLNQPVSKNSLIPPSHKQPTKNGVAIARVCLI